MLERDEGSRSIKLPFGVHVTDEYAGLTAWVLLEVIRAPPRAALAAEPTPRAMVRLAVYFPPPNPHSDGVPSWQCVGCILAQNQRRVLCPGTILV